MQKGLKELQVMKVRCLCPQFENAILSQSETDFLQRQTVVSQFFQLDRLVVEGQKTGKQTTKEIESEGNLARVRESQGFVNSSHGEVYFGQANMYRWD